MIRFAYFAIFLCLICFPFAFSQEMSKRLTNQDIIDMVSLGLSDDIIVAKIRSVSGQDHLGFDTSVNGLKALKAGKVSDEVIKVMINPAPPPVTATVGAAPATASDPNLPPPEIGVYWKDGTTFVPVEGRALSKAKAGGRAGSYFTYGMRSQHWDATLDGSTSKNHIKDRRPLFYFYVPDGTSASDFVLIKLEKKSDHREFQIGSFGGLTAGKSGVKSDKEISFHFEHVAIRTFRVTLSSDLKPGEYAFFMGTGQQVNMAESTVAATSGGAAGGRIYDFSVPD
jgi:hypothetical protein